MTFLSETKETDRFQKADHVLSWRAKLDMFIEPGFGVAAAEGGGSFCLRKMSRTKTIPDLVSFQGILKALCCPAVSFSPRFFG